MFASPNSLAVLTLLTVPLAAEEPQVAEVSKLAEAKAGEVALLDQWEGDEVFPAGSVGVRQGPRGAVDCVSAWLEHERAAISADDGGTGWGKLDILVCPNGERGKDAYGANNFTFVSARFVAEVTQDVQAAFAITRSYLGGHSQGGFVTYSVLMHYPDLFDGAFPMAGDCWLQNEPNLWESKPEVVAKQKKIAIGVIHGQADPVVRFSQGEHAHGVFLAMGYPKLRFFRPKNLGHQFALSPVPEALAWLDAMTGLNPKQSLKLAEGWLQNNEPGWAYQTALAIQQQDKENAAARKIIAAVETQATQAAEKMQESLASKPAREWLPQWYEFRRQFGATAAARELLARYNAARNREREKGRELFRTALSLGRQKKNDDRNDTLQQILQEAPHTYHAWYALDWLKEK